MRTFTITEREYATLLIMLGYATGAASERNPQIVDSFVRLANAINKDNPAWTPYDVPPAPEIDPEAR